MPGSKDVRLTIVIPAYNEERYIADVLERLLEVDLGIESEIIVVDDGSTDNTPLIVERYTGLDSRVTHLRQHTNYGKGAAVRAGISQATGTHLLVFDADAEYCVKDITRLLEPVMEGKSDVVYGTRIGGNNTMYQSLTYRWGNQAMTLLANLIYGTAISDLHTCLKLVPVAALREMRLREHGFGLDTEITAQLLKGRHLPYEVPISYVSRSKSEGKKIAAKDALRCAYVLARVKLRDRGHRIETPPMNIHSRAHAHDDTQVATSR